MHLPLKSGVTTSEFWLVILSGVLLTVQSAMSLVDAGWAMGGITLLGLAYTQLRGRLKSIHAQSAADALKSGVLNPPADAPPSA
jgi:hypothetical protein